MKSKIKYSLLVIFCFLFMINVHAENGFVTSNNGINLREAPSTDSAVIVTIPNNANVYISNIDAGSGNGCDGKWYNISYNSKTGYGCSNYISITNIDSNYLRPWNTPKKAIIGGAQFISTSYISKGQFTSYLKKFNVNPNAYYSVYNHQYMANMRAPVSESESTFKSLKNNNLLNYAYNFSIPVYNNMPESTWLDGYWVVNRHTAGVQDEKFENSISSFPETYKPYLRYLHTLHNNWTFDAMNTNLDFNSSASLEKSISSIQISSGQCEQNPYKVTETGWCIGTDSAIRFFLDPRNFFSEANIFIFEDLSFKDIYNDGDIQNILNGTFMSSNDKVENLSYASIFMEAGRTSNVNPLYLASLARIESGTTEKNTTSGTEFSYNGITYSGLFNFFNIGAYSSESNPALAGLVWANGTNSAVNNSSSSNSNFLNILQLRQTGSYVRGYNIGTTISNIKNVASGTNITIKDGNGTVKSDNDVIGTGYTIEISKEEGSASFVYVLYGDLNGDGEINSADLLKLRQHLLGTNVLGGANLKSAYINNDSEINSADLLAIRQYLLGIANIGQ